VYPRNVNLGGTEYERFTRIAKGGLVYGLWQDGVCDAGWLVATRASDIFVLFIDPKTL